MPEVLILSGPAAAGKSTVALALAERYDRVAHVPVDVLRRLITPTGFAGPSRPAYARQQHLALRNACSLALNFLAERIAVMIEDAVVSPEELAAYVDALRPAAVPIHYIRLLPSLDACLDRNQARKSERIRPERVEASWRVFEQAPEIGGATLDSSSMTVNETADKLQSLTTSGASIVWQP